MSRSIDADALHDKIALSCEEVKGITDVLRMIKDAPTVDAVEVVRCKDCKFAYFITQYDAYDCSRAVTRLKEADDFCSVGEQGEPKILLHCA